MMSSISEDVKDTESINVEGNWKKVAVPNTNENDFLTVLLREQRDKDHYEAPREARYHIPMEADDPTPLRESVNLKVDKTPIDMMAEEAEKIPFENHLIQLLEKINEIPDSAGEVFLWDLIRISNGDLYLIRLRSLADKNNPDIGEELCIKIVTDEKNKSLSIIDTGIGMTEDELKNRIGKTPEDLVNEYKDIIDTYLMGGDPDAYCLEDSDFGIGFYLAFMVAHTVVITTKQNGDDQYVWESKVSDGYFSIARDPNGDTLKRGTKVTLYLKDEHLEYLNEGRLRVLVGRHTFDLCPYPIEVNSKRQQVADEKEDFKKLEKDFEGLRQLCLRVLKGLAKEVVVTDRVFDLPSNVSVDKKRFEINPRNAVMKLLLEDFKKDPADDYVEGMINLHYSLGVANITLYDEHVW